MDEKTKMLFLKFLKHNSKAGFTALELILSFGVLFTLTAMAFFSLESTKTSFNTNLTSVKEQGTLRRAMEVVKRDLKEAKQGMDPDGSACNEDNPSGVCIHSSPAQLAFKVPESTAGTETSYKTIKYTFDSQAKTLTRYEIPSSGLPSTSTNIIGRNITNVSFSQTISTAVSLTMTIDGQTNSSRIALRNNP